MNRLAALEKIGTWRLFVRKNSNPSTVEIIGWWELRRIAYNLIVGGTGVFACGSILGLMVAASEIYGEPLNFPSPPILPLLAVLAYGICANIFYTGGWIGELLARKIWPDKMERFASVAFFFGLLFSVVITLLPTIFFSALFLLRLFFGLR
jgi:hypothetical protein